MDEDTRHQVQLLGFQLSFVRFGKIIEGEDIPDSTTRWRPLAARAFVERLILCQDDESVRRLIRGDPEGTAAFSEVLLAVDAGVRAGEIPTSRVSRDGNLPFHFLCCPVIDFLDAVQREYPHKYVDP